MRVRLDVEADGLEALAELHGQRQADVAEADDADLEVAQVEFSDMKTLELLLLWYTQECHTKRRSI